MSYFNTPVKLGGTFKEQFIKSFFSLPFSIKCIEIMGTFFALTVRKDLERSSNTGTYHHTDEFSKILLVSMKC